MTGYKTYVLILLLLPCIFIEVNGQKSTYKTEGIPFITEGSADDYAPVKYKDGIVFISNRKRGVIDKYEYKDAEGTYYSCNNYYYSKIDSINHSLSIPELFDVNLASRSNKGPLVFSADEKTMYFTKNLLEPRRLTSNNKDNPIGIFTARFDGAHWTDIKPFPYCTGKYSYGHPLLSPDEKRLYFVSDTVSGEGGLDIWFTELKNGQWSPPVNMGPNINSTADEANPILLTPERLYFTSKPLSRTHVQNYYSDFLNNKWTSRELAPDLLGINSNIRYFLSDSLMLQGYYVEERGGKMRIRKFSSTYPKFDSIAPIVEPKFCFTFYDKAAPLLDTSAMMYEWDFGKGEKVRGAQAYHCFPQEVFANYVVNLNVIDKVTGEVYFSQASYNFAIEDFKQVRIKVSLKEKGNAESLQTFSSSVNQKVYFSVDNTNLKGLKIEQFFWDFGDPIIKPIGPTASFVFRRAGTYKVKCGATMKDGQRLCNYITLEVKNVPEIK